MQLPIYCKRSFFTHYINAHQLIFFLCSYITGLAKNNKIQEFPRYSYIEIPAVKRDNSYKNTQITDASRVQKRGNSGERYRLTWASSYFSCWISFLSQHHEVHVAAGMNPFFSSPEVSYCYHLVSVVRLSSVCRPSVVPSVRPSIVSFSHFNLLLWNCWAQVEPNLAGSI